MSTDKGKTEKTEKNRLRVSSSASKDIEEQVAMAELLERISIVEQQAVEREAANNVTRNPTCECKLNDTEIKEENERPAKLN